MDNANNSQQVVEISLGWLESISLISSIASLVISLLAIWLSIKFYQMSTASSKEIKESSSNVNNNVEKLEKMFDTMYRDTFSMVKDTVTHMRRQEDRNLKTVDYSDEIQSKVAEAISDHLKRVEPEKLNKNQIKDLVMDLVKESKDYEVDVKRQFIKNKIIFHLNREGAKTYKYLEKYIFSDKPSRDEKNILFDTMYEMTNEGIINADFTHMPDGELAVNTSDPIELLKKQ